LSRRAQEDARQIELLDKAWKESGRVYGYCKLHDDLLDQGEISCANRVARLARLAGIKAQIGYRRRPGSHGGKPSVVVDNTLARQFDVDAQDKAWVTDITYIRTPEGFAYRSSPSPVRRGDRVLLPDRRQASGTAIGYHGSFRRRTVMSRAGTPQPDLSPQGAS